MQMETKNNIRILTPSDGMWLYNSDAQTFSQKVYLGVNANAEDWVEITEEEKIELEAKIEAGEPIDDTNDEYAEAGKILLGVSE